MSEATNNSGALIPLSKGKRNAVIIGSICLMLSIAMLGVGFFVIQGPVLEQMGASEYYSLMTIFASLGLAIMTPIGGKLGDLFGRKNVIIVSGVICAVCGIGMGIVRSIIPFILLRLLIGAAQGAFTAAPYILMREINEPKDVPKYMGLLASAIAIGGFGGSILLGAVADAGYLSLAIIIPVIPLLVGVILIAINLPNKKNEGKVVIDIPGIICLTILLSAFCLVMNYGPIIGWTDPKILVGIAITLITIPIFVKVENKANEPIVPMYLFKNSYYTKLLVVGFICYFYQTAMNAYAPLAMQQVMGISAAVSGSVQLPRSILTMVLPAALGVWVGKKNKNLWIAMAMATGLVAVAFVPLGFTNSSTSMIVYFIAIAITGIAESFRSVSVTPAAQATLDAKDLGVGTALVTFVNSLAGLFAAAIYGAIYGINSGSIQSGVNQIFLLTVVVSIIGCVIVVTSVRKHISAEDNTEEKTK